MTTSIASSEKSGFAEKQLSIGIATPLAEELVASIAKEFPQAEIRFRPDLLPPQRYVADHSGDPSFVRSASQEVEFNDLLVGSQILYGIPGESSTALAKTVKANPSLRWVQAMAAGAGAQVRKADLSAQELAQVAFTTSAGVHAEPLAEFAIFGLMCGIKNLVRLNELKSRHEWAERWPMRQFSEQVILVVGLGSIGRAVAAKTQALGAKVIGISRSTVASPNVDRMYSPQQLEEAVAAADGIILALPDVAETRNMFDDRVFSKCRPGTTLVNLGRGTVINEADLLVALDTGAIGQAVLDVFAKEPLATNSPLWDHPQVIISPHTAALTPSEDPLIVELFKRNLRRFLTGEKLINLLGPDQLT